MKVTKKWLEENSACREGIDWVLSTGESKPVKLIDIAIESGDEEKLKFAEWGVAKLLKRELFIRYAIYAAEQVIRIYEDKYSEDKRPRKAIEAAKRYISEPTEENKNAAARAADSADAAARAARAARVADAADSAADAAYAAYAAAAAARKEMRIKILTYGKGLIQEAPVL